VGSEALNIFQMYERNGDRAGFWVRRNSWGSWSFAQVLTVQGRESGPLAGVGPYFNDDRGLNPIVEARIWYRGVWCARSVEWSGHVCVRADQGAS
jgi:hypothetical protein